MREVKVIIIISIIVCLAAPVLLYFGLNYYRDKKYAERKKDFDKIHELYKTVDSGIRQKSMVVLDSVCIEGLSEKILSAIYEKKELRHPKMVEHESGWGMWYVFYLLKDQKGDTISTLSIILFPRKGPGEWKIETFKTEIWRKEAEVRGQFGKSKISAFSLSSLFSKEGFKRESEKIGKLVEQLKRGIGQNSTVVLDSVCANGMSEKILDEIYKQKEITQPQIADSSMYSSRGEGKQRQWQASLFLKKKEGDTDTAFRIDVRIRKISSEFKAEAFEMWKRIDKD